jgi:ubiquinone/menaquinone biosynthesis C-methylase UbiE
MIYEVMDVTNMAYEDNYFDLVLDKSTIDALLCSENPYLNTAKMMEEVWRVLKNGGIYLVISYSSPESRNKHFIRPHIAFDMDVQ